jgi:hypothetical protein
VNFRGLQANLKGGPAPSLPRNKYIFVCRLLPNAEVKWREFFTLDRGTVGLVAQKEVGGNISTPTPTSRPLNPFV